MNLNLNEIWDSHWHIFEGKKIKKKEKRRKAGKEYML